MKSNLITSDYPALFENYLDYLSFILNFIKFQKILIF